MKTMILLIYGFLFCVFFFLLALLWHAQMSGVFFVSPGKGVISDFFPPFIEPGVSGSFFLKSRSRVYVMWMIFVGIAVVVPAVASWLILRTYDRALKKAWM